MNDDSDRVNILQKQFQRLYFDAFDQGIHSRGGIFTAKARERLLGIRKFSGPGQSLNDFRYLARKRVKLALLDLSLFIDSSRAKDVKQVVTKGTLSPFIAALFDTRIGPDAEKAKIAQLFIETGFQYLRSKHTHIPSFQERQISDAIDLSKQLTAFLLPEDERRPYAFTERY
jgi:hypothetical protein